MADTICHGEFWRNGCDHVSMIIHVACRMDFQSELLRFPVQNTVEHFLPFRCEAELTFKGRPNEVIMKSPIGHRDFLLLDSAECYAISALGRECKLKAYAIISAQRFHALSRRL